MGRFGALDSVASQSLASFPSPPATLIESRSAPSPVCAILKDFARATGAKMSFDRGEISALCRPFVKRTRADLDLCGDSVSDPYTSKFTWATRAEMYRRGKINIVFDSRYKYLMSSFESRLGEVRKQAAMLCCGDDERCRNAMESVEVSLCKPQPQGTGPDPCVFGGSYTMPGEGYSAIFTTIRRAYESESGAELRDIATRNLSFYGENRTFGGKIITSYPRTGKIILTSYVQENDGVSELIPTLHHEFGHACSMIRMQLAATSGADPGSLVRASRAVQWLNHVKDRCDSNLKLPDAYYDFWESLGETREFAQCLYRLTEVNRKSQVDRACDRLCPGHYLEESVGIAFSLLNGDLHGNSDSVFPNTCDHVRDGQHPMVSDVVDCLARYSPRFRARVGAAYGCDEGQIASSTAVAKNLN